MPKKKAIEDENRCQGKNENKSEKKVVIEEDGQEHSQVINMLGYGQLEAIHFNGGQRLSIQRKTKKKDLPLDIILVGLQNYQDNKGDKILKYNADEAKRLGTYSKLSEHA